MSYSIYIKVIFRVFANIPPSNPTMGGFDKVITKLGFVVRATLRDNIQDLHRNLQYPANLVAILFLPIDLPKDPLCTITPFKSSSFGAGCASVV